VSDPVALAVVGAVVTLGGAVIANGFLVWRTLIVSRAGTKAAETAVTAIAAVAVKTDNVHAAISDLEVLRKQTTADREAAAERYERQLAQTTGTT
jgi:hypothetical protein